MPSQRLEQIQAAIQKLTEAKIVGLTAEIAAAKVLLSVPLPPDLTPQQILDAGQARLDQFGQAVKNQENIAGFAKAANGGIEIATANLQQPDRLAISPEVIDTAIDSALGIAAQATKLFIDPETGIVIAGRQAGELKSGQQLDLAKLLAEEDGPISQENLSVGIFGRKGKERPGDVRSLIAKLNRGAKDQDLPPVVVNPGRKGYGLGPEYEILGIRLPESTTTPGFVESPFQAGKPESYSISQVLAMEGISGVLSETQTRRLTQELLAKGHLRIGAEVMEGRAQARGASSKVVRDLELTPAGVEIMRDIANQFGAQSRISTDEVVDWLAGQKDQPVATVSQPPVDTEKRYLISQVAAQTGIPDTAIKVLHQIGALKEGIHFEQRGRVKVYKDEAFSMAQKVEAQARKEGQNRYTERLIRKAVGFPKENDGENPYGPNGPSVLTSEHERIILDRLKRCESGIEQRLKRLLGEKFKTERDQRLGELTDRLAEDESLIIDLNTQQRIRREAAATIIELSKDARSFNFVRKGHPGLELALLVVKALDEKSVRELAESMINPPNKIAGTIERNGLVNGIRTVGPMGDK